MGLPKAFNPYHPLFYEGQEVRCLKNTDGGFLAGHLYKIDRVFAEKDRWILGIKLTNDVWLPVDGTFFKPADWT